MADAQRAASMPAAPGLDPATGHDARLFRDEFDGHGQLRLGRFGGWRAEVEVILRAEQQRSRPLPSP